MSKIRPSDATYVDQAGDYYRIDAVTGQWFTHAGGEWFHCGPVPELTPLPPAPSPFDVPVPREPYNIETYPNIQPAPVPTDATHRHTETSEYYKHDSENLGNWFRWSVFNNSWVAAGRMQEPHLKPLPCTCGRRTPFQHMHATDCPIYSPDTKGVCGNKPDHADELGKVWDVLHANSINGAEGLSASEGVQKLAAKLLAAKKLLNIAYAKALKGCTKCDGTGFVTPDIGLEMCECISPEKGLPDESL